MIGMNFKSWRFPLNNGSGIMEVSLYIYYFKSSETLDPTVPDFSHFSGSSRRLYIFEKLHRFSHMQTERIFKIIINLTQKGLLNVKKLGFLFCYLGCFTLQSDCSSVLYNWILVLIS